MEMIGPVIFKNLYQKSGRLAMLFVISFERSESG